MVYWVEVILPSEVIMGSAAAQDQLWHEDINLIE
jgi:hypothetical protein